MVGRFALTSTFEEVFRLMSWLFIAAAVLAPFRRPPPCEGVPQSAGR